MALYIVQKRRTFGSETRATSFLRHGSTINKRGISARVEPGLAMRVWVQFRKYCAMRGVERETSKSLSKMCITWFTIFWTSSGFVGSAHSNRFKPKGE